MTGVRKKKTQQRKRVNNTKPGFRRKKKDKKVKVLNNTLRKNWDKNKTIKQNLHNLGLAFDANVAVPVPKAKNQNLQDTEDMEVDKVLSAVVEEFEQIADSGVKVERHISPGEAQFLWQLVQDHGNNYKTMAKDKRNYYQHTPNQLKRKCEAFLRSKQDFSTYLENVN